MSRLIRPILVSCKRIVSYPAGMQTERRKSDRLLRTKLSAAPYCTMENEPRTSAQLLVDAANKQKNPMAHLTPFKCYKQLGLEFRISCHRSTELHRSTIMWALSLTRDNMHSLYEESEWGWSEKVKLEELSHKNAWYLLVRTPDGHGVAFVHFRFDLDCGTEVLYCYEIQLENSVRRIGLGKYLMLILELIAKQTRMKKVMLTVFKHNLPGRNFFSKTLRYEVDPTSPVSRTATYEILSKKILLSREMNGKKQPARSATETSLRIKMPKSMKETNKARVGSAKSFADQRKSYGEGKEMELKSGADILERKEQTTSQVDDDDVDDDDDDEEKRKDSEGGMKIEVTLLEPNLSCGKSGQDSNEKAKTSISTATATATATAAAAAAAKNPQTSSPVTAKPDL